MVVVCFDSDWYLTFLDILQIVSHQLITQEDEIAFDNYFCGRKDGFFLEIGANGGKDLSNTYAFDYSLHWSGILIDGDEGQFNNTKVNRPNTINLFAPICASPTMVHYVSNGSVGGIVEFMSDTFKDMWYRTKNNDDIFLRSDCVTMPCHTLQNILDYFKIRHIHFFSLDTEGAEWEVLQGLDLGQTEVDLFVIEMDGGNPGKESNIRDYLTARGFQLDRKDNNEWWLRKDATFTKCG